jgi:hemoglobin-like flavoprotein
MDTFHEILNQLGQRHVRYGVSPHSLPFLGQALFMSLRELLGSEWTDDLEDAWTQVYDLISSEMMRAMFNMSTCKG